MVPNAKFLGSYRRQYSQGTETDINVTSLPDCDIWEIMWQAPQGVIAIGFNAALGVNSVNPSTNTVTSAQAILQSLVGGNHHVFNFDATVNQARIECSEDMFVSINFYRARSGN